MKPKKPRLKDLIRTKGQAKGLIPTFDESEANLKELAEKLLQTVLKNPEHQAINNFSVNTKIPMSYIRRYARDNEYFGKAYELARTLIGVHVSYKWEKGFLEKDFAIRLMEIYNDEWRELLREKYQAKKELDKELSQISVIEIPTWDTGTRKPKKKEAHA